MKEKKKRKILAALIPVAVLFLAVVVFAQGVLKSEPEAVPNPVQGISADSSLKGYLGTGFAYAGSKTDGNGEEAEEQQEQAQLLPEETPTPTITPEPTKEPAAQTAEAVKTGSLERKIGDRKKLALELGIGEITLTDIVKELEKPARDPRDDMPAPILRSDVLDMKDLKPGMILKGTVRNVIDFGVFVDIGVHQDGLVHISQITDRFIKHPLEAVSVGDIVDVQVLSVDVAKKRISLTMKIGGQTGKES